VPDPDVVLVTGARKGIGRHLAEHFLAKGALVEGCSREPTDLAHARYHHHNVDVTSEPQVVAMVADIARRHKRLDVAINNAGVASMNHALLTPMASAERVMATNFLGTFVVCREAAKLMRRQRRGRIVNLGSIAVPLNVEGEAVYAASKSAVVTFTRTLARELAEWNITCNVVGPAPIETDLIRGVPHEKIQALLDRLPLSRAGRYEDVANVVDFFTDPASGAVTGQVIYLGGA
jgi:3-oxoacyl-[acyl-carrier protein] reductase